jgi:cytochrome P450
VVYSIYLTHRHPQFWQDPQRFDPDRFAAHRRSEIAPYSFLPFGGGPRNCIGAAFAQIEARVVLARILQRFELEPAGAAIRPYMGATLEPHPGVPMYIRSRRR